MTAYEYFGRAERVEQLSAEIYAQLARDFAADKEVSAAFRALAEEEQQHALRIRLMRERYRTNPALFERMEWLEEDLDAVDRYVRELRDEVARGAWGTEVALVHPRLLEMEERLGLHAERMARDADPDVRGFFEALAQQDRAHHRLFAPAPAGPR
ncbi:ferritin family protein [Anaeromyxobacter diazotrophicus]|uniref:Rubrerythrin diiron-binding domain-containing protein n=1 Tax=Anaeromyxobacter diazotrophicus TaxID=2590199 RepID=A0A7I9VL53_9BACT|nr:ferritin family protein [Anaeromyxobacter diazotrophicus]GEJ57131.1 hypothetical protein AMYX_18720 [Anaeromyxobacter diazotrophicus]